MLAACRCWQQGEALWKDSLVPRAEAVFRDPVDRSQRALAAWVLHVAASPPEVPHACVFYGTLLRVGDPAVACRNCRLRSARIERLVSESSRGTGCHESEGGARYALPAPGGVLALHFAMS